MNRKKRYYVDFYDLIDGWGGATFGFFEERLFDDLNEAIECCKKLQKELPIENRNAGEHYGVIDGNIMQEVYCGKDRSKV